MTDFFDYCNCNDVDVMSYRHAPSPALTIRDGHWYCVAIDFSKVATVRELRGCTMHEFGHLCTGALHKCSSPYQIVQQAENKADRWSFEHYLPVQQLQNAMRNGYTQTWELAEYFDLPEQTIVKALHYWTECRGVDFNTM